MYSTGSYSTVLLKFLDTNSTAFAVVICFHNSLSDSTKRFQEDQEATLRQRQLCEMQHTSTIQRTNPICMYVSIHQQLIQYIRLSNCHGACELHILCKILCKTDSLLQRQRNVSGHLLYTNSDQCLHVFRCATLH